MIDIKSFELYNMTPMQFHLCRKCAHQYIKNALSILNPLDERLADIRNTPSYFEPEKGHDKEWTFGKAELKSKIDSFLDILPSIRPSSKRQESLIKTTIPCMRFIIDIVQVDKDDYIRIANLVNMYLSEFVCDYVSKSIKRIKELSDKNMPLSKWLEHVDRFIFNMTELEVHRIFLDTVVKGINIPWASSTHHKLIDLERDFKILNELNMILYNVVQFESAEEE